MMRELSERSIKNFIRHDMAVYYESFGAAISLLIYLYASALAILFEAEVNATRPTQP